MTSPAERKIAEAIKNGEFDNLRGMGEPLPLDDLARDENLAHRLLVDNGFSLPWIEIKLQIDEDLEEASRRLSQRVEWLQGQGEIPESSARWAAEFSRSIDGTTTSTTNMLIAAQAPRVNRTGRRSLRFVMAHSPGVFDMVEEGREER